MPLLRCFSTLGCPDASLDEVLTLAEKHDVGAVEVRALGGSTDLPTVLAAQFGTPAHLARRLRDHPRHVVAFGTSWHLAGGTEAERAQLLALLPWAEALGTRWLRVFDARPPVNPKTALDEAARALEWWREVRARRGSPVEVMIETHDLLLSAERVHQFRALAPEPAILWDTHHTWRKGGEPPAVTWAAIRDLVVHVHVKDSVSRPSSRHPWTYVFPGDGEFPGPAMHTALAASRFAGAVSLEWERLWHPDLPPLDEALRLMRERGWW